jgi:pimeloyl-ACP methyl ester carboxylesterase
MVFSSRFIYTIKTYTREITPVLPQNNIILVLHGWNLAGGKSWHPLLDAMSVSFPSSTIIAPDLPGMGESSIPKTVWGVEEYTHWAKNLCNEMNPDNSKNIILIGHSFGGVIAAKLATNQDLHLKHVFLLAPAIIREQKPTSLLVSQIKQSIISIIPSRFYQAVRTTWRNIIGSDDYKKTSGIMREIFSNVITQDTRQILQYICVPTTILWGENDTYTPSYQAEIIHSAVPHSKLALLPNINHGIHLHAKETVIEEMQKILDENQ